MSDHTENRWTRRYNLPPGVVALVAFVCAIYLGTRGWQEIAWGNREGRLSWQGVALLTMAAGLVLYALVHLRALRRNPAVLAQPPRRFAMFAVAAGLIGFMISPDNHDSKAGKDTVWMGFRLRDVAAAESLYFAQHRRYTSDFGALGRYVNLGSGEQRVAITQADSTQWQGVISGLFTTRVCSLTVRRTAADRTVVRQRCTADWAPR